MAEKQKTRADCVILDPTGRDDIAKIREVIGYRLGTGNISMHIRLALRTMARMSEDDALKALDLYMLETGGQVEEVS